MNPKGVVNGLFGGWWGLFELVFIVTSVSLISFIGALVVDAYFFRGETTGKYKSSLKNGDFITRNLAGLVITDDDKRQASRRNREEYTPQ